MKCLLAINRDSGQSIEDWDAERLRAFLHTDYDIVDTVKFGAQSTFNLRDKASGYDAVAVAGGDGTLNHALNALKDTKIKLIYVPSGTLNDAAVSRGKKTNGIIEFENQNIGKIGDKLFSYVAAAGSFTSIGYLAKKKSKKLFKRLTYFALALREYRVHRIQAKLVVDKKMYSDTYTLVMAVKSKNVFGFPFNRANDPKSQDLHLLLIKAPARKGFLGALQMFFPFFRAFFIGFSKPYSSGKILFMPFRQATIELAEPTTFTVDGERIDVPKRVSVGSYFYAG